MWSIDSLRLLTGDLQCTIKISSERKLENDFSKYICPDSLNVSVRDGELCKEENRVRLENTIWDEINYIGLKWT